MAHVPRIHWPEPLRSGQELTLDGDRAHHLLRVLKRRAGDELILFQPGTEFAARILEVQRHALRLQLGEASTVTRESPLDSLLVQGVSRGERMDFSIQKCVELGISAIQPVLCRRSGVQLDRQRLEKKQEHWQAVALSAAEQSGRTCIPRVLPCVPLVQHLDGGHRGFVLAPGGNPLEDSPPPGDGPLELLVGPEGGLDQEEMALAARAGLQALSLGPRILRTETAGLAALSALQYRWGDLAGA